MTSFCLAFEGILIERVHRKKEKEKKGTNQEPVSLEAVFIDATQRCVKTLKTAAGETNQER